MQTKMTLSASIVLYRMLMRILLNEDGTEKEMPFTVKYKLHRCKGMLEKDIVAYEEQRVALVNEYGTQAEDGSIKVDDDKMTEFTNKAQTLLSTETEHAFNKLTVDEVKNIVLSDATGDEMDLFIACMVNDPELETDLKTPIQINNGEVAEETEKAVEGESATNK